MNTYNIADIQKQVSELMERCGMCGNTFNVSYESCYSNVTEKFTYSWRVMVFTKRVAPYEPVTLSGEYIHIVLQELELKLQGQSEIEVTAIAA